MRLASSTDITAQRKKKAELLLRKERNFWRVCGLLVPVQTSRRRDSSFLDVFLKLPTMSLLRNLAEAPKDNQFPKIPFIPRSDFLPLDYLGGVK